MAQPQVADQEDGHQVWRIATNILVSIADSRERGDCLVGGLGEGLTIPHLRNQHVTKYYAAPRGWTNCLE